MTDVNHIRDTFRKNYNNKFADMSFDNYTNEKNNTTTKDLKTVALFGSYMISCIAAGHYTSRALKKLPLAPMPKFLLTTVVAGAEWIVADKIGKKLETYVQHNLAK